MRKYLEVGCLALLALLGGCGQELLAGGQREGEVTAEVTDDPQSTPSRSVARRSVSGAPGAFTATFRAPEGTVEVDGSVALLRDDGVAVPLSSGGSARVRIGARDTVTLATRSVRSASYSRARITFTRVEADVTSGLLVGGVAVSGRVRVPLSQPLTLELPTGLVVQERGKHRVIIDLNSSIWLLAADPVLRTVPQGVFAAAVQLSAR